MCILAPATGPDEVERVLAFLEQTDVSATEAAIPYERHPDVARSWLAGTEEGVADLNRLPLFASLSPEELSRIASGTSVVETAAGETIVEQWDTSKDFYVVLAGEVEVIVEDRVVRTLAAGEFFGELAALDWGSGYGYPRLASVACSSDVRLLRVPAELLNELVEANAGVAQAIRRAARERLATGAR
jgi:signal-transduction protein with cAMP-binding, CBS, and nucleotidyltransferase domain